MGYCGYFVGLGYTIECLENCLEIGEWRIDDNVWDERRGFLITWTVDCVFLLSQLSAE